MPPPPPLPRVLTPRLRERFGISESRTRTELRHGTWRRLASGVVLARPDEPTREDWADVGVHLAGPGAALSGWDALQVRGLGDRRPPRAPVLVLSPSAGNGRLVGGVRIRGTNRGFDRTIAPLGGPYELTPIVGVARALCDAALVDTESRVMAMVTQAVQRERCTSEELRSEYADVPRNGSAGLRRAIGDVLDGARSIAEARAARRLANSRVPGFELNVPVVDEHRRVLFVLDELWRELRAAVEIDSREHHFSELDWEHTLKRHNVLTGRGLALLHFAPKLVTRRDSTFVPEVHDWLVGRAVELGVPLPTDRGVRRPPDGEPVPLVLPSRRPRQAA